VGFAVWPGWGFAVWPGWGVAMWPGWFLGYCVIAWPGWPAGVLRQFAVARLAGCFFAAICGGPARLGFCGGPAVFFPV